MKKIDWKPVWFEVQKRRKLAKIFNKSKQKFLALPSSQICSTLNPKF